MSVIWFGRYTVTGGAKVGSDVMFAQNSKKFNDCCYKVWGNISQCFRDRLPSEIERFLSYYFGKSVELMAITFDDGKGYPTWEFVYREAV